MATSQFWIEWFYDSKNLLQGDIVQAAKQPVIPPTTTKYIAVTGPYSTRAAADAALKAGAGNSAPSGLTALGTELGALGSLVATSGQSANAGGAESTGQSAGAGFWAFLKDRALWIRIAEGTLGVLLILAGVAKLAEDTPAGQLIKKVPVI